MVTKIILVQVASKGTWKFSRTGPREKYIHQTTLKTTGTAAPPIPKEQLFNYVSEKTYWHVASCPRSCSKGKYGPNNSDDLTLF